MLTSIRPAGTFNTLYSASLSMILTSKLYSVQSLWFMVKVKHLNFYFFFLSKIKPRKGDFLVNNEKPSFHTVHSLFQNLKAL